MSDKDEPVGRSGTGTARAGAVATDKQVEARQACDVMEDGRVEQMAGTTRKKRSSQLQGSNIFVRLSHRLGAKKDSQMTPSPESRPTNSMESRQGEESEDEGLRGETAIVKSHVETTLERKVEEERLTQISTQFRQFFSAKKTTRTEGPDRADGGRLSTDTTRSSDASSGSGKWTAPDSWAVTSETGNEDKAKKSISAKLLEESHESQAVVVEEQSKSNTRLISAVTVTSIQEEGIKPDVEATTVKEHGASRRTASQASLSPVGATGSVGLMTSHVTTPGAMALDGLGGGGGATEAIGALWSIRVFKPARESGGGVQGRRGSQVPTTDTFVTLACPLDTSAEELCKALAKKFLIAEPAKYQLFVRHRRAERMLAANDKPLLLQKKWLQEVGYGPQDALNKLGRDDNRFVCQFLYAEIPSNLNLHEALLRDPCVRISELEAVLPGQNLYLIPVVLFKYGATLQSLDLSRNLMLNLPIDFVQSCGVLKSLRLANSELDILPLAVTEARSLRMLDLGVNLFRASALTPLARLTGLTHLNLQANQLSDLPTELAALTDLMVLNVASNYLTAVPSVVLGMRHLQSLDLSFNYIKSLPSDEDAWAGMTSLAELTLACNMITVLPLGLAGLQRLTLLDLRGNAVADLSSLRGMPQLQRLQADYNDIAVLGDLCMPMLVDLTLTNNPLSQVALSTHSLPSLRMLSLATCKLLSLPSDFFRAFCRLEKLILDDNRLRALPTSFGLLRASLATLSCVNNKLEYIPDVMASFGRLVYLDLRGNNVLSVPAGLWRLPCLDVLNLSSNLIDVFPLPPEDVMAVIRDMLKLRPGGGELHTAEPGVLGKGRITEDEAVADWVTPRSSIPVDRRLSVINVQPFRPICNLQLEGPPLLEDSVHQASAVEGQAAHEARQVGDPGKHKDGEPTLQEDEEARETKGVELGDSVALEEDRHTLGLAGSLREFYIGENRLKDDAMDAIQYMLCLQILNLSYNDMYELPKGSLSKLGRLRELYLSGNQLTTLASPEDLGKLELLKILHINGNKLVHLPAELGALKNLQVLDTSSNNLRYNIVNFQYDWNWNSNLALRYLNLSGNSKLEISSGNAATMALPTSDPSMGYLSSFKRLSRLRLLDLSGVKVVLEAALPIKSEAGGGGASGTGIALGTSAASCAQQDLRVRYIKVDPEYWQQLRLYGGLHPSSTQRHANHRIIPVSSTAVYGVSESPSRINGELFTWDFIEFKFMNQHGMLGGGSAGTAGGLAGEKQGRDLDRNDLLCGVFEGHQSSVLSKYLNEYFVFIYSTELAKMEKASAIEGSHGNNSSTRETTSSSPSSPSRPVSPTDSTTSLITLSDVMRRTFVHLNRELGRLVDEGQLRDASGAAGIVVHVYGRLMIVGNVGDTLGVLCRGGRPLMVSTKHTPWNRAERARIRRRGGYVDTDGLVDGQVHVSRAFGYFDLVPSITSEPQCHVIQLNDADEFIILANNGLWNWIDPETAVDIVRSEPKDLSRAAARLRDVALSYGTVDPICIVILSIADFLKSSDASGVAFAGDEGDLDVWSTSRNARRRNFRADELQITDSSLARLPPEITPPMGNVVIAFTDIRNSTLLWELMPQAMEAAIKIHHVIMRRLLRTIGGYEVKTEGDAFMVAFPAVDSALRWCLHAQTQLLDADWPKEILQSSEGTLMYGPLGPPSTGPSNHMEENYLLYRGISVRMGLHHGTPIADMDPITHRMDYFGNMVNKAARISATAKGGQICCSQEAFELLRSNVDATFNEGKSEDGDGIDDSGVESLPMGACSLGGRVLLDSLVEPVFFEAEPVKLKGFENAEKVYICYPKLLSGRHFLQKTTTEGVLQPTLLTEDGDAVAGRMDEAGLPSEEEDTWKEAVAVESEDLGAFEALEGQEVSSSSSIILPVASDQLDQETPKGRVSYYGTKLAQPSKPSSLLMTTSHGGRDTDGALVNDDLDDVMLEKHEEHHDADVSAAAAAAAAIGESNERPVEEEEGVRRDDDDMIRISRLEYDEMKSRLGTLEEILKNLNL